MAIAHDAVTTSGGTFTADKTISHTPVGTPKGVVVMIVHVGTGTDQIAGVTYGGVPMGRVRAVLEGAGELGAAYSYFLGSGIPAGAQNAIIDVTSTDTMAAVVCTVTADAETTRLEVDNGLSSAASTNPSIALATGIGIETVDYGATFCGDTAVNTSVGAGMTEMYEQTLASNCASFLRKTANGTGGSVSLSWTINNDDVAAVVLAISEPPVVPAFRPTRMPRT